MHQILFFYEYIILIDQFLNNSCKRMVCDSVKGSLGYINIPIHVLHKNDYIESMVERQREKKPTYLIFKLKKLKQIIFSSVNKFKEYLSVLMKGFYHEIVLNNVDIKTKQNLICYIQSLNLDIIECGQEDDGTKVFKIDIAPIKNKPDVMNDLLVYIENEKLKIARRSEANSKCRQKTVNEFENQSDKWSTRLQTDTSNTTLTVNCDKNGEISTDSSFTKLIKLKNNEMQMNIKSEDLKNSNDKHFKWSVKEASPVFSVKDRDDSLIKKDKLIKDIIDSNLGTRKCSSSLFNSSVEKIDTNFVSQSHIKIHLTLSSDQIEENKDKPSINTKMNSGIGLFWNIDDLIINNQKISVIERNDKIKENSKNIVSKVLNERGIALRKQSDSSTDKEAYLLNNKISASSSNSKSTLNDDISISQLKDLSKRKSKTNPNFIKKKLDENNLNKDSIQIRANQNKPIPLMQMKDSEPYTSNGFTSDPKFKYSNKNFSDLKNVLDPVKTNQEVVKQKKKFYTFWKKSKKNNKRVLSVEEQNKILQDSKRVASHNKENDKSKHLKQPLIYFNSRTKSMPNRSFDINQDKYDNFRSNVYSSLDRGDSSMNISLMDTKKSKIYQSNNLKNPINLNMESKNSTRHKQMTVVNKLFKKLKKTKQTSDSEITSSSQSWANRASIKMSSDDYSMTSSDSFPSKSASADTIQSSTEINRREKSFPSRKEGGYREE